MANTAHIRRDCHCTLPGHAATAITIATVMTVDRFVVEWEVFAHGGSYRPSTLDGLDRASAAADKVEVLRIEFKYLDGEFIVETCEVIIVHGVFIVVHSPFHIVVFST